MSSASRAPSCRAGSARAGYEDLGVRQWPAGRRASELVTRPWQGLLQAVGAVYSLIHEGQNGGPVRGCRGGRRSGRGQLRAAAGPAAPSGQPDGAGSRCITARGVRAGAACCATGRATACPPLPPSLTPRWSRAVRACGCLPRTAVARRLLYLTGIQWRSQVSLCRRRSRQRNHLVLALSSTWLVPAAPTAGRRLLRNALGVDPHLHVSAVPGGLVAPGRGLMTGPAPILVAGAGRAGLALARQGHPSLVLMIVVKAGRPSQDPHPRACQGPWQMSHFN
jgi:hypothetical protein